MAQLVAHHTCGGCNLLPGDLFGTGTISGPTEEGYGSLIELSDDGTRTITLASGETRTFLEDGDEVIFRAHCRRDGYAPIGFGECRAGSSEGSRMMVDALGWRMKFGVIAPSTNTVVQPEFDAMRPRGVTNHFAPHPHPQRPDPQRRRFREADRDRAPRVDGARSTG